MRYNLKIGRTEIILMLCAAALLALVYVEGWVWPLKAAAVMIPVTLLIG